MEGEVVGEGDHCSLVLGPVGEEQTGVYLCMLSLGLDLDTVRKVVRLELATPPLLSVHLL